MDPSPTSGMRDRIAGSLYGLLLGDALGCPVEGWTTARITREFGRLTEMEEPRGGRWRPAGLHSDDGQQALAVCDAVLADPAHPGPAFAGGLVALLRLGPQGASFGLHRGTGGNFRRTVGALAAGTAWDHAASPTAGNGAAMRIGPVALFYRALPADHDALLAATVDVSRVTHRAIRGIAAAGAVAWLVARALAHQGPAHALGDASLLAFVRAVEDHCAALFGSQDHLRACSTAIEQMLAERDLPRAAVLRAITTRAQRADPHHHVEATSGFALASVVTSIYLFLSGQDFEQTVIDTLMLGGDADTTGALVGQMCGALYGEAALPERWRAALLAYGLLEDRIDALLARQAGFTPAVPLVELERPWTMLLLGGPRP